MAAHDVAESVEEALELCLTDMERACSIPFEDGVRKWLKKESLPKFVENHPKWPKYREVVRHSATFIGRFAEQFAAFDDSRRVREVHVKRAVLAVKPICVADGVDDKEKLAWCPDF